MLEVRPSQGCSGAPTFGHVQSRTVYSPKRNCSNQAGSVIREGEKPVLTATPALVLVVHNSILQGGQKNSLKMHVSCFVWNWFKRVSISWNSKTESEPFSKYIQFRANFSRLEILVHPPYEFLMCIFENQCILKFSYNTEAIERYLVNEYVCF